MRKIYFDSSVYVKAFTQEPGTDNVNLLLQLAYDKRIQILLSEWAINETLSAVDRKYRRHEITEIQRETIIATVLKIAIGSSESSNVAFVPVHSLFVDKSRDFILNLHLRPSDALHLYTAYFKRCECFICHDGKLKKAADYKLPDMRIFDVNDATEMNMLRKSLEPEAP